MNHSRDELTFLNFDFTLTEQKMLHQFPHKWVECSDIQHTNGFCEASSLEEIRRRLDSYSASPYVFIGNGNYHYITYLLMEKINKPFSLVLFDHHADMMIGDTPLLSCGSWVSYALNDYPLLQKAIIVGVNDNDCYSFSRYPNKEKFHMISETKLLQTSLNAIFNEIRLELKNETNIYISVDKDVLYKTESITNWDQGHMSLVQLLYLLEELANYYTIIGMDVCGEYINLSEPFEASGLSNKKMNEIVNWALIEFMILNNKAEKIANS